MNSESFTVLSIITGLVTAFYVVTSPLSEINPTLNTIGHICSFVCIFMTCKCSWREAWAAIGVSWIASMVGSCFLDTDIIYKAVITLFFISFIQLCIAAFKTVKRTVEVAGEVVSWVVRQFIDLFTLKNEIKRKCPAALKMQILEKKKNAINVGIFNNVRSTRPNEIINIESTEGISPDIQVGAVYMLND